MHQSQNKVRTFVARSVAALVPLALAASGVAAAGIAQPRTWTTADNLLVDQVLEPFFKVGGTGGVRFLYSSDGALVAYIVETADPAGTIRNTLKVHRVADVEQFAHGGPVPADLAGHSVELDDSLPSLSRLTWSRFGERLYFLRRSDRRTSLYEWTVEGGARTAGGDAVDANGYVEVDAGTIALTGHEPVRPISGPTVLTGDPMTLILQRTFGARPGDRGGLSYLPQGLYLLDRSRGAVDRLDVLIQDQPGIIPSPDGRYIAFFESMRVESDGSCWIRMDRDPGTTMLSGQLAILDRSTGTILRPFNAPMANGTVLNPIDEFVAWSRDSTHAVVGGTFTAADRCGPERGPSGLGIYSLRMRDGATQKLFALDVTERGFVPTVLSDLQPHGRSGFAVGLRPSGRTMLYRSDGVRPEGVITADLLFEPDRRGVFRQHRASQPSSGPANQPSLLSVCQGLNELPVVCVRTRNGTRTLLDLSARVRDVQLDPMTTIEWTDSRGARWSGYLQRPEGQGPFPLILQTHGNIIGRQARSDLFLTTGPGTSVYPGRAAVGRGYAVLTIVEPRLTDGPRDEGPRMLDGYRAAINLMVSEGIADRTRIGIIGFSRTSYYTKYLLTHAPDLVRAAIVSDGLDFGIWQYFRLQDWLSTGPDSYSNLVYGGYPADAGSTWFRDAPDIRASQLRVPVRVEGNGPSSLMGEWGFYAAMRSAGRPVDLIFYPSNVHHLRLPADRLASQTGALDWFDFWLQGIEHPDPLDPGQYERWRAMRAQSAQSGTAETQ